MENKTDAALQILSIIPESEIKQATEHLALLGFNNTGTWQILVKYNGDIEEIARREQGAAQIISSQFASLNVPKENIGNLLNYTEIEYMEVPKSMTYNVSTNMTASCISNVQKNPPYRLKGRGVLLAIIDSGINYFHPDFRNDDGTTRITSIWDQTITGNPPSGFLTGTEYTREQINEALKEPTKQAGLLIVPSEDTVGHGTHVAGIAGGNGRGSAGEIMGAAPESEFIIVKLGQPDVEGFVRNVEIMLAVRYVLEKARELGRPVAINISVGMNSGPHDGTSLIELYLSDAATIWKNNIVVGAGNEGNARNHTEIKVEEGGHTSFQFRIGEQMESYNLSLWHSGIDQISVTITDPTGRKTPMIVYAQGPVRYTLQGTTIYATFTGPSPLSGNIEFALVLNASGNSKITSGAWTVDIYGESIIDGRIDIWGPTLESGGGENYFLSPVVETTLTTPSTSNMVTTVGAYNHITNQIAPFSGRGFTRNGEVKPDLVAPGVEILSASHTSSRYRTLSGTSMATPHVTGGIALIMQWGIVQNNNPFLYGENLKTYLLRGATRDSGINYPSPLWGYGRLCVEKSLDLLRRQLVL